MVQVAAERSETIRVVGAGLEGSDLQGFIPIRVENDDAHNEMCRPAALYFQQRPNPTFPTRRDA